jgi:oligoribonuclease
MTTSEKIYKANMGYHEHNLIWLDMEMTGLDPKTNHILEIAVVITSPQLEIIAQSEAYALRRSNDELALMDKWNVSTHTQSGLLARVAQSTLTEDDVSDAILKFMAPYTKKNIHPMCGNSICQDRRFMYEYMPKLEAYFHYRNIDVSTLKELAKRWSPNLIKGFHKKQAHTALADILESIDELRYYQKNFLQMGLTEST